MFAIEVPEVDDDLMKMLSVYAPAAYNDLLAEVCRVTGWKVLGEWVSTMDADGYRPIALLVHDLARIDWHAEIEKIREAIKEIVELERKIACLGLEEPISPSLTRKLHGLRLKRVEKTDVSAAFVKQSIADGRLIVRYGDVPYLPVTDGRDFCLDSWLEKFKPGDLKTMDRLYPDGRMVVKMSEVASLLIGAGVEVPDGYLHQCVESRNNESDKTVTERLTKHREEQIKTVLAYIADCGYDPKKIPNTDKTIKNEVRLLAMGKPRPSRMSFNKKRNFDEVWSIARSFGYITEPD